MGTFEKFFDVLYLLLGAAAAVVVYWWRRRTRLPQMALSPGSERLSQMVEKGDKPEAEDVVDMIDKISQPKE
jgi:hypothetical protein